MRDLLLSLSKALKASRVYRSGNPAYQKLYQDFVDSLTSFLKDRQLLALDVGQFQIHYLGETVYESRDPSESLAIHFYRDGIRQLRFLEEIEAPEIEEFFEILKSNFFEVDADDDLATLLWEKDLPNIDYVAVDALTEEGGGEGGFNLSSMSQSLVNHGKMESGASSEIGPPGGEPGDIASLSPPPDLSSSLRRDPLPIFSLSEQEVERIGSEMREEADKDLGEEFVDLLLEILSAKVDIEGSKEVLAIVERISESYCLQGDFLRASNTLRLLNHLIEGASDLPESRRESIREAVERLGNSEKLKGLASVLNRTEEEEDLFAFISYVSFFGSQAIMPLCEILGDLKRMKARRILCEAIAKIAQGHLDRLGSTIKDSRWYLVRNVAYIFGLMRDPQGVRYLKELIKHEEPRVKKEAIRSLGLIGDAASRDQLLSCLNSPEGFVRISTVGVLSTLAERRTLPLLLKMIEEKQFADRDWEEKRAIFEAVGRLGSDQVLPLLKVILLRRAVFHRSRVEEMRRGAALALSLLGTEEARRTLEEGTRAGNKAVVEASRWALSKIHLPTPQTEEENLA